MKRVKKALLDFHYMYFNISKEYETIGNIIRVIEVSKEFKRYQTDIFPKLLIDKVRSAQVGERSEIENAFIWNLKLRNYTDTMVYYQVYKHFPETAKAFEDSNFIENCINAANEVKAGTREYKNNNIWDRILKSFLNVQKINFNQNKLHVHIETFRYFLELLYKIASVTNSFEINYSNSKFQLLGHRRISRNTIVRYSEILKKLKYIKITEYKKYEGKKYPFRIELKDLSNVKKGLIKNPTVNLPSDGYQDLFLQPGINPRSQKIIQLLRDNESMSRKLIQSYFLNINGYKNKINKSIRALLEKKIIVINPDKTYSLTKETFHKILGDIKKNMQEEIDAISDFELATGEEIKKLYIYEKRMRKSIENKPKQIKEQLEFASGKKIRKKKKKVHLKTESNNH